MNNIKLECPQKGYKLFSTNNGNPKKKKKKKKILGRQVKNRVGRVTGNRQFFLLSLIVWFHNNGRDRKKIGNILRNGHFGRAVSESWHGPGPHNQFWNR